MLIALSVASRVMVEGDVARTLKLIKRSFMQNMYTILKCNRLLRDIQHVKVYCKNKRIRLYSQKILDAKYPKRIFSGIQPTGSIHLGNYFGAIQKWIELQEAGEDVLWSIVDMHSITQSQDTVELKRNILKVTATLIACGIDPKKSVIFQQSSVPMHAELCWILICITTMARLAHLPQFKEKSKDVKNIPLGLYVYPVLQSADILLYKATHVPVGQDQAQHIQLSQDLAHIFNTKYGETFPIPRSIISRYQNQRIKSLRNPSKKMSKSDKDEKSRIELTDDPDVVLEKVKKAMTDCISQVTFDPENRPGVANLISIHSSFTGKSHEEICESVKDLDTGKYKLVVADIIIEKLEPIQKEISALMKEPLYLEEILKDGTQSATELALDCWLDVKNKVGFETNAKCWKEKEYQSIVQTVR